MKKSLYISFLILFLVSCKQPQSNDFSQENIIEDTLVQKIDTLTKISEPFKVNDIECYWIYKIISDGGRIMNLKEHKTDRVLLEYFGYRKQYDYEPEDYFDEFNKENFRDINFDGFKDFLFQSIGISTMNSSVGIFIFDNKTKTFEEFAYSDYYSNAQSLIEIDSVNKRLITANEFRFGTDSIIHYFDKKGKVKFAEVFTGTWQTRDTINWTEKRYQKIVNGEIVEEKKDSIIEKW